MEPQLFSCGLVSDSLGGTVRFFPASMEPQLFSCGLKNLRLGEGGKLDSFNGAATFQLRIALNDIGVIKLEVASMEPQLFSCGLLFGADRPFKSRNASMEPQLFSCGLMPKKGKMKKWMHRGFNGAATFQLRIVGHDAWSCDILPCFNGAATFQLRIEGSLCLVSKNWHVQLQWSRNFSVAD